MRKHITIKETTRDNSYVYFQIVSQSHISGEFVEETEDSFTRYTFHAKNGIKLKSVGGPEWRPSEDVLFVRGTYPDNDKKTLMAYHSDFKLIKEAIDEYNQRYGSGISVCLPDDLFVVE
jgi:hypothetical protein